MKEKIDFNTYLELESQLEIKMGMIVSVSRVPKSDKMLKLSVLFKEEGIDESDFVTVLTNIGNKVSEDDLLHKTLPFVTNLTPSKIMGIESHAMIMVGTDSNGNIDLNLTRGSKLM